MTTRRSALGLLAAAATVPAWPRAGAAQSLAVSITVTLPPLAVAPMAVFLEAELTGPLQASAVVPNPPGPYRPAFHETTFVWTLPGGRDARTPDHLVNAHRQSDRAFGQFISEVFDTPGPQTVIVDAYLPDGRHARGETTFTVGDPAQTFDPQSTIVVSATGDFDGAPGHDARNAVTTLDAAFDRLDRINAPQAQILLARDQTHVAPADRGLQLGRRSPNCHIGAWGRGPRPVIDLSGSTASLVVTRENFDAGSIVLRDLHFKGGWDPTTELWSGAQQSAIVATRGDTALLLHNCHEEGCAVTVNSRPPRAAGSMRAMTVFNEYAKTNFKDFLLLGPRDRVDVGITKCRVVQHPDALNGGENRGATSYGLYGRNAHNFIRCSADRLYVASNDIFIRHGWALNKVFDNPAFRLNRNDIDDMRAIIARNHIEGMLVRASKQGAVPMNLLIEQNYIVSNPSAARALFLAGGAATLRNNIVLEHDTPKLPGTGSGFQAFVTLGWDEQNRTTRDMPFLIYNNSFISLRGPENSPHGVTDILNRDDGFSEVLASNNLLWAPGLGVGDGPLNTSPLQWNARYRGARLGWARIKDLPLPAHVFPGEDIRIPYWVDFFGQTLTQANFAGQAGRHSLSVSTEDRNERFDALSGEIAVTFEPDGIRVTNQSASRWPKGATLTLHCDRGTTPSVMDTSYGHPEGTLSLYAPLPGSPAHGAASGPLLAFYDFLGALRPGTAHPDAPAGQADKGAVNAGSTA